MSVSCSVRHTCREPKTMAFAPRAKHEADLMAFKLFCLFSFILVGLITSGLL
jgi:hypothetical protein